MKRVNGSELVAGLPPERVQAILDKLGKDIGAGKVPPPAPTPAPQPKPPAGAPPRRLLESRDHAEEHVPAPASPAEEPALPTNGDLARAPSLRSALRRPGARRNSHRRISYVDESRLITRVQVASYRGCGEQLWFFSPGAVVTCDSCEKDVPQSMGTLQGAPTQSQFAQSLFLCGECSAR